MRLEGSNKLGDKRKLALFYKESNSNEETNKRYNKRK